MKYDFVLTKKNCLPNGLELVNDGLELELELAETFTYNSVDNSEDTLLGLFILYEALSG